MSQAALWFLGMSVVLADGRVDTAALKDKRQLQGAWVLVSYVRDGKPKPRRVTGEVVLIVDGLRWSVTRQGYPWPVEGIYQVDPAEKPRAMDITFANGIDEGKIWQAVYKLQRDRFTLCLPHLGKARPTRFLKKRGFDLLIWERKKR